MHPLFRTQAKLILSFVGVCLLVGVLSLVAGGTLIGNSVLTEATARISQDLNAAWEIYDQDERVIVAVMNTIAADPGLAPVVGTNDSQSIRYQLSRMQKSANLDFSGIAIRDPNWRRIAPDDPPDGADGLVRFQPEPFILISYEERRPISGTCILSREFLESIGLSETARIEIVPTPRAAERPDEYEHEGMAIVASIPLYRDGRIYAVLYGGKLINRDRDLVDRIRDTVFRDETYQGRKIGTATIFFRDLRIATNVLDDNGDRAIGTQVSREVKDLVLDSGERWSDRAFVVNDWYRTAYDPIVSPDGESIGMLYVGVLDAKYVALRRNTLVVFTGITGAGVLIAIAIGYLLGRLLLRPVNLLIAASDRVRDGNLDPDIGPIVGGELGVLQQTFSSMLKSLRDRAAREKEESETKLLQSEKQASVGRLAAGVAHEINNPLTSVLTFTHLLLERDDLPKEAREDLDTIAVSTERVRSIIRDLLDFSRQTEIHPAPTEIDELIAAAVKLIANQARSKGIDLVVETPSDLPMNTLDRSQMQSVLINLLLNAIDATESGGSITVTAGISIASGIGRNTGTDLTGLEISVSDTGRGIDAESMKRLFDPFYTTKASGEGTGLGLAVSLGIIERHGGDIRVRSTPGKGSTFVVWLPLDDVSENRGSGD